MKIFQQKYLCLLTLFLLTVRVYGQYGTIRFNYRLELEKSLIPQIDTTTTRELALFCEMPSLDNPEKSIRIVKIGNQSFIEARILKRNLWIQLQMIRPNDSLLVETYYFSAPISNSFRNKILKVFSKVVILHRSTIKPKKVIKKTFGYQNGILMTEEEVEGPDIFDGTSYLFRINSNGIKLNTSINCPLASNDFRYQVSMANLQIINDLKNSSFNESNYNLYK